MTKVCEYLKHHREHSVSEIITPLPSDDLRDCGASRWDCSRLGPLGDGRRIRGRLDPAAPAGHSVTWGVSLRVLKMKDLLTPR